MFEKEKDTYALFEWTIMLVIFVSCLSVSYLIHNGKLSEIYKNSIANSEQITLIVPGENMKANADETKVVNENFKRWNDALLSKDPKKVAELYTLEATFLPTMSPKFMYGKDDAEGYFEHFLKKNPSGKVLNSKIQVLSSHSYLHSGLYNFAVDEGTDRKIVEARFTFLWIKDQTGVWKIAHHHSSVKPK